MREDPFPLEKIVEALNLTSTPRGLKLRERWMSVLHKGTAYEVFVELYYRKELTAKQLASHLNRPLEKVVEELDYLLFLEIVESREITNRQNNSESLYRLRRGMPAQDHSDNDSAALYILTPEWYEVAKERIKQGLAHIPNIGNLAEQWVALHDQYMDRILQGKFAPLVIYCSRDYASWAMILGDGRSFILGPHFVSNDELGEQALIDFLAQVERLGGGYTDDIWGVVYAFCPQSLQETYEELGFASFGDSELTCLPIALNTPGETLAPLQCCSEDEVIKFLSQQTGRDEVTIEAVLDSAWLTRSARCLYFGFLSARECVGVVGVGTNGSAERLLPLIAAPDVAERLIQSLVFVMSCGGNRAIDLAIRVEPNNELEPLLRRLGWVPGLNSDEWRLSRP